MMNVAQHWRLNEQRYRMTANTDSNGNTTFPPRPEIEQRTETRYVFVEEALEQEELLVERVQQQAEVA